MPGIDDHVGRTVQWVAEAIEPGDALVRVRRKKARRRLVHRVQRSALVVVVLGALAGGFLTLVRVFGQIEPRPADVLREGSTVFVSDRDGDAEIYLVRGEGPPTRLTDNDVDDLAPAWSPDGTGIAFLRREGQVFHPYAMTSDGTDARRVTPEKPGDVVAGEVSEESMWFSSLSWSPDGTRIVFGGREIGLPCPAVGCPYLDRDIFSVPVSAPDLVNLTDTTSTNEWDPAWSPDGSRILFVRATELERGKPPTLENIPQIYSMAADGSDVVRLTKSLRGAVHPAWSPDGSRVVFEGDGDIFVMNADGSGITRLAVEPPPGGNPNQPFFAKYEPGWSPDGERIVFVSDRDGDRDLYVMPADGTEDQAIRLTDLEGNEYLPAWQPSRGSQPSLVEEVQKIQVGPELGEIAVGEGGVWATTLHDVVRLDPATGKVVARVDLAEADPVLGGGGSGIAVGFGSVWVANPARSAEDNPRFPGGSTGGVLRIDPATNRPVDSVVFTDRTPLQVAVGEGAVWVGTGDTVTRLDPGTLEVEATIPVNRGSDHVATTDIAVGEGSVWVAVGDELPPGNAVARIDPRTNRVVAYVELFGHADGVAVGEGVVWATVFQPGFLVRIDPATNSEAARVEVAERASEVATGGGVVWVGYIDYGARGVAAIDARTGESLRRITLGSGPTDVVVGEAAVWVAGWAADGVEGVLFRIPV